MVKNVKKNWKSAFSGENGTNFVLIEVWNKELQEEPLSAETLKSEEHDHSCSEGQRESKEIILRAWWEAEWGNNVTVVTCSVFIKCFYAHFKHCDKGLMKTAKFKKDCLHLRSFEVFFTFTPRFHLWICTEVSQHEVHSFLKECPRYLMCLQNSFLQ